MTSKVESTDREHDQTKLLLLVMTHYLGGTIIPEFKKEKLRLYSRIIQQFHVVEISNSH